MCELVAGTMLSWRQCFPEVKVGVYSRTVSVMSMHVSAGSVHTQQRRGSSSHRRCLPVYN